MEKNSINNSIKLGISYTFFVLIVSTGITLFMIYYGEDRQGMAYIIKAIFSLLSFLPLLIFKDNNDFSLPKLGFNFNWRSVILTFFIVLLLSIATGFNAITELTLGSKLLEGVAGTGEEFFFRGFIYLMVLQMFKDNERYKNVSAMILSSLIFTIAHTEIFLGTYHFGFLSMFFNTFITFAVIRHFSRSLLPVVAIHTFMNGGIVSCIIGILITSCIMYINHVKEREV